MRKDTYGIRHDPATGQPYFWKKWTPEQRRLYLRGRAVRAGIDVSMLEEIIREAIEALGPDLRRFKVDLPTRINEAIRELKAQRARGLFKTAKAGQGCGGAKHYGYDIEGKTRRFCSHE